MHKIALVVQRCHQSLIGGSESLAWQYATLLSDHYEVEILTTTALDYVTWANVLPPGDETREKICIRRFSVEKERTHYWHQLHERLRKYEYLLSASPPISGVPWTNGLQEEFIRQQGPYSPGLLHFLLSNHQSYQAILFVTYIYPTTYYGLLSLPSRRCLLVPTLHNEISAHLAAFRHMAARARSIIWLTEAEERIGKMLWGDLPGKVVAMPVDTQLSPASNSGYPYLLYAGRIDADKGCDRMLDWFIEYKKRFPSHLRFVLIGADKMPIPSHPDIEYRGFVSDEEKFSLMAGADVFVLPSPYESFSISTLEAMAQRTLPLVNGDCEVLADHVALSGTGKTFHDKESYFSGINDLLNDSRNTPELKDRARDYVVSRYSIEQVRHTLINEINALSV